MRIRTAVTAVVTTALLSAVAPIAAHASEASAIPSCTDISYKGGSGQINVRSSPSRAVAWNIAMYDPALNDGPWIVDVYVNDRREDHKEQTYQPHGSINASHVPVNSFISIEAWHTDLKGAEHVFVPNRCIVA